jgi:hypothetical protein
MQADSPQFSELCASVLKPANLSGGSQTWKLLELTPLRPTALSCNLDQGGDNESYQKDVLGRLTDITPGAWHASTEATNELNGRVGVSGYTVNRYHHPTPMRGARMMNLTRSQCL